MKLSVIIPAFNEEKYLGETLKSVNAALARIGESELIVVDNESTDETRAIAESFGVKIADEREHNIGQVRNTGARNATGECLAWIDADTVVPEHLFERITAVMSDTACLGGAVEVLYGEGMSSWTRAYIGFCHVVGRLTRLRQGAAQFCRREAFDALDGYDRTIWVGEDVEFQQRLDRLARERGARTVFIDDLPVTTSPRRFARFGLIKTMFYTHPLVVFLTWRRRATWKSWYDDLIR